MLRFFDIVLSVFGLVLFCPLFIVVIICGYIDTRSPIFHQKRVGKEQQPFTLLKFRTMSLGTDSVATHLAEASAITQFGKLLRKSKIDELPQLINVLRGEMSLVGPRPCLLNQVELIEERNRRGVFDVKPGITGLAQVNKIDMSQPTLLAEVDASMLKTMSFRNYFNYLFLTVVGKGFGDRVKSDKN